MQEGAGKKVSMTLGKLHKESTLQIKNIDKSVHILVEHF